MTTRLTPDICIIGGGSGGLSVAAAAAAFGVEVVLLEKGKMGGDCLNYGCVPSKAMIAAGKHAHAITQAAKFGVNAGPLKINFQQVHDHVHGVIEAIAPNDSVERFRAMGVRVIEAAGHFIDKNTVMAGDIEISARRFVIATGSSAFIPPITGLETVDYLTNETLFEHNRAPQHLIVIGGGPIGMEMAQAYRRLGAQVTLIEAGRALGKDDPELAAIVLDAMRLEGITVLEDCTVTSVEKHDKTDIRVCYECEAGAGVVDGSDVLVAVGRVANIEGLGLDAAGIRHDQHGITVGANLRTTNKRVYAIGDVVGGPQFTHVAGYHAGLVVQQILFRVTAKENRAIIPFVTYTDPELAHVGLNEEDARKHYGTKISILRWPYAENDRAQAERKTRGLIKIVVDRKARILGVSIAGAGAGEMINMWALAVANTMTLKDIRGYISPYPTLAEIGKRATLSYYTPLTRKPFVRGLVRFLRRFG